MGTGVQKRLNEIRNTFFHKTRYDNKAHGEACIAKINRPFTRVRLVSESVQCLVAWTVVRETPSVVLLDGTVDFPKTCTFVFYPCIVYGNKSNCRSLVSIFKIGEGTQLANQRDREAISQISNIFLAPLDAHNHT